MSEAPLQNIHSVDLLGLKLQTTSYEDATHRLLNWVKEGTSGYVCVANVHMIMEAYDNPLLQCQINKSLLTVPDGMPLVWLMRRLINPKQTRVYGPTLMLHVCDKASKLGIPIGLYGSSSKTLERLKRNLLSRFPGLEIAYSLSPPFCAVSVSEDQAIIRKINDSGIGLLFVALGCPKQEKWMAEHSSALRPILVGVGAAFDFHADLVPQSPALLQKVGLEWFFRLCMEPRRLWKRYLKNNPRFVLFTIVRYYRQLLS